MERTLLEVDVSLIDQDDGFPRRSDLKHAFESHIKAIRIRAQIASPDKVQGSLDMFASRFGREGFTCKGTRLDVFK